MRPARESSDQQAQDENQPDVSEEERKNLFASDEQQVRLDSFRLIIHKSSTSAC